MKFKVRAPGSSRPRPLTFPLGSRANKYNATGSGSHALVYKMLAFKFLPESNETPSFGGATDVLCKGSGSLSKVERCVCLKLPVEDTRPGRQPWDLARHGICKIVMEGAGQDRREGEGELLLSPWPNILP